MNGLAIDTSTQTLGIAVLKEGKIVGELTINSKNDHATRLLPSIQSLMEQSKLSPSDLDRIVVANGPGSYTGTRIGVTTAKTMAWQLNCPLYTASTLASIAWNGYPSDYYLAPFIDARRGNVFTGLYVVKNDEVILVKEERHVGMDDWLSELKELDKPVLFLSPDIKKQRDIIKGANGHFMIPNEMTHLLRPAHLFKLTEKSEAVATHQAVPNYLRQTEAERKLS